MKKSQIAAATALSLFAANANAATVVLNFGNFDTTGIYNGNGRYLPETYVGGDFTLSTTRGEYRQATLPDPTLIAGGFSILTGSRNATSSSLLEITSDVPFLLSSFKAFNSQVGTNITPASYNITSFGLDGAQACSTSGSIGVGTDNNSPATVNGSCSIYGKKLYLAISDAKQLSLNGFTFTTLDAAPAVPEPATWTMGVVGFGMIGAFMRRRKPATVTFG